MAQAHGRWLPHEHIDDDDHRVDEPTRRSER